jgi:hypothetical protein
MISFAARDDLDENGALDVPWPFDNLNGRRI